MSDYVDNPSRVWNFDFSDTYTTSEGIGTSSRRVQVPVVNLYNYKDLENITREEIFVWVLIDQILVHFIGVDIAAAAAVVAGQPFIPTRAKFGGATKGTSPLSIVSRRAVNKQMPFRLPMITGRSLSTLKISMTKRLGAWGGRTVPIVGWIILAYDVEEIIRHTLVNYNKLAKPGDKLW
ncbi:STM2901 family protein [Ralstonia psammae]|uniref:STM2901 family protein n=1 Tax=Ralstonia psammae TaxID=3058598 RepID=UPI00293122C9|nr:hypothetical protein [Ralstonia sp. LMG 19083]